MRPVTSGMLRALWPLFERLGQRANVTDRQRQTAFLRLECGRTWAEIATEMGATATAARQRFSAWCNALAATCEGARRR